MAGEAGFRSFPGQQTAVSIEILCAGDLTWLPRPAPTAPPAGKTARGNSEQDGPVFVAARANTIGSPQQESGSQELWAGEAGLRGYLGQHRWFPGKPGLHAGTPNRRARLPQLSQPIPPVPSKEGHKQESQIGRGQATATTQASINGPQQEKRLAGTLDGRGQVTVTTQASKNDCPRQ